MKACLFDYFFFFSLSPQVEIIGGADKYLSVCRKCYPLDFQNNKENELVSPKPTPTKSRPTLVNSPTLVNLQPLTAMENEIGVEDFQPPPLVNIKINQVRGKLFSSPWEKMAGGFGLYGMQCYTDVFHMWLFIVTSSSWIMNTHTYTHTYLLKLQTTNSEMGLNVFIFGLFLLYADWSGDQKTICW